MRNFLCHSFFQLPGTKGIWLFITHDGVKAFLLCVNNYDFTKRFSPKTIENSIKGLGLKSKLNHKAIQQFSSLIGQGTIPGPTLVAMGRYGDSSKTGSWVLADREIDENHLPMKLPNHFYAESIICDLKPSGRGVAGIDVWGKHINSFPDKKPDLLSGIREEAGKLIAELDGFLFSVNGRWTIINELSISGDKTLFYSPLNVSGSVAIEGDLPENIQIYSSTNVYVQGNCNRNVKISAEKSVRVDGEVRHARIVAKEGISCRNVFHSVLEAGENIEIRQSLSGGSRATAHNSFFTRDKSNVSNSIVEAFKEVDIWSCGGVRSGKTTIHVGLMMNVERRIKAYDKELSQILRKKDQIFTMFNQKYGHILKKRHEIYALPKKERKEFEKQLSESTALQEELDEDISEIKSIQNTLREEMTTYSKAKIRVRNQITGETEFWIGRAKFRKGNDPLKGPFMLAENENRKIQLYKEEDPIKERFL